MHFVPCYDIVRIKNLRGPIRHDIIAYQYLIPIGILRILAVIEILNELILQALR